MPEVDGLAVCERLLKSDSKPRGIIVVTANPRPEITRWCESVGAFQVRKGVDLWDGVRIALTDMFPDLVLKAIPDDKSQAPMKWERPRVLLIDGHHEPARILANRLQKNGVDALIAGDATRAIQLAANEEPRVIILDFPMVTGDPYYLIAQLRNSPKTDHVPIFVTSGRRVSETIEANLRREVRGRPGATHFFVNSFGAHELFRELQKYCAFTLPIASA